MTEKAGYSQEENLRLHNLHLQELIQYGILELIIQHGDSQVRGQSLSRINLSFGGEPIASVTALRTKQEDDIFYGESIDVSYDGAVLCVKGAHPTYQGPIQADGGVINKAIREAFDEYPKRTIITDFNPRKYIY